MRFVAIHYQNAVRAFAISNPLPCPRMSETHYYTLISQHSIVMLCAWEQHRDGVFRKIEGENSDLLEKKIRIHALC